MIIPLLLAAALLPLPLPAKPPAAPTPDGAVMALSTCAACAHAPAVVAGGAPGTFTAQWKAVATFDVFFRTFDLLGNAGTENQIAQGNLSKPAGVGSTAAGGFVIGWEHPQELYVGRLDPAGKVASNAIRVNPERPNGIDDDEASIAVRPDGGFLVVWNRFGTPTEIFSRRGDASGALEPQVVIGESADRAFPVACFTPSGGSVAAWTLRNEVSTDEAPTPAGIALRRMGPDGAPLGQAVQLLAPAEATTDLGLALACAPDGGFVVAWHTRRRPAKTGLDILLQRFNAAGVKQGQPQRINTTLAGDQTSPALLVEKNGGLLVVWASAAGSQGEIRGRRLSAKGRPVGAEFLLHRAEAGASDPAIASVGEIGQFVLAWNEQNRNFARVFRP